MSFWWRRWMEQSRSPRCTAWPLPSASTWISMWRGASMYFSTYTAPLPKAACASALRLAHGGVQLRGLVHDADALAAAAGRRLDHHRQADRARATSSASAASSTTPSEPGVTGTPAAVMVARAAALSPIRSIDSGLRADELDALLAAEARELGALGQEAIAGMDGLGAGLQRRLDQGRHDEVALRRRRRADAHRLVGVAHVQAVARRPPSRRPRWPTPSSRQARMTRMAISPRLAMRTLPNTHGSLRLGAGEYSSRPAPFRALATFWPRGSMRPLPIRTDRAGLLTGLGPASHPLSAGPVSFVPARTARIRVKAPAGPAPFSAVRRSSCVSRRTSTDARPGARSGSRCAT